MCFCSTYILGENMCLNFYMKYAVMRVLFDFIRELAAVTCAANVEHTPSLMYIKPVEIIFCLKKNIL